MDCGPASLTSLLEGFGIAANYGRLREACQTDVDGTSIDTLEEIASNLGLNVEQIVIPIDHVLLKEAAALPAIAVVQQPGGLVHFEVVWSVHAGFVQVMDPAMGRTWVRRDDFLRQLYVHQITVPAAAFEEWARSPAFTEPLVRRMEFVGARAEARALLTRALDQPGHEGLAELDAAVRMITSVVRADGLPRGPAAARAIDALLDAHRATSSDARPVMAEHLWTARTVEASEDGTPQVSLRGAVLLRAIGVRPGSLAARVATTHEASAEDASLPSSPALRAVLESPATSPGRELLGMIRQDGLSRPTMLLAALVMATCATIVEALLLRSLLSIGEHLGLIEQRIGALVALVLLSLAILLVEIPATAWLLGMGRNLELRLRIAFLSKVPMLPDRYLQSRPASDMAQRLHAVHVVRSLSGLGARTVRTAMELLATSIGLVWLSPKSAPLVVATAITSVLIPFVFQPILIERDLRQRVHTGALSRFYLDALLGLAPIRTHAAERIVRRAHEDLLVEWSRAGRSFVRTVAWTESLQAALGFVLAIALFAGYLSRGEPAPGALLFVYWALNVPALGSEVALLLRQYPAARNTTLRLLEPLGALPETKLFESHHLTTNGLSTNVSAAHLQLQNVGVIVSGHVVLQDVDIEVHPAEHVAIVGVSGAGKSTLVGLLLGWYRAAAGEVLVDGAPLEGEHLATLRRDTAWVDPAVQLWNRSLFQNLAYGTPDADGVGQVLDEADLRGVVERLPDGLETALGEGGGLVSGGEGQRVRLGRAFFRPKPRLVVLDEPFRGLDRTQRRAMLRRSRSKWAASTLLCITHDVGETLDFPRVLVIEQGRIVEDGPPRDLQSQPHSRYRALLDAEESVRKGMWASSVWRKLTIRPDKPVEEEEPRA